MNVLFGARMSDWVEPLPQYLSAKELLLYFVGAMFVTIAGTLAVLRRGGPVGLDAPDGRRKLHEQPISRLGGAPIFVTLLLGLLVGVYREVNFSGWMPIVLCNILIFLVGFADDLKPLGARIKLFGQVGTALILYTLGLSIDVLSNPFGEGGITLGWWSLPLTVFWLVAIPNIINLIDGMDGLAGGFGLFLSLTLAFIGFMSGRADVMVAAMLMAGALAGFLIFNFPPARIFLGDGGAYLIGFFVASVSLKSSNKGSVIAALLVVVIALGVPILDTTFAIVRRTIRGVPIFRADAEHIHHRLILLGYSKGRALAAMYSVCVVLSLIGISILLTKGVALPAAGAVLFLLALAAARYLGYVRSWSNLREQIAQALDRRRELERVRAHARVLDFDIERCESLEQFAVLLKDRLNWAGFAVCPGVGTCAIQLGLSNGRNCTLFCPENQESLTDWQTRADCFLPVFERCQVRWGQLPVFLFDGGNQVAGAYRDGHTNI